MNKAYTTPQAGLLPRLSTDTCRSCSGYEEHAVRYVNEHLRYTGPVMEVLEVTLAPEQAQGVTILNIAITQRKADLIDSTGKIVESFTRKQVVLVGFLTFAAGYWLMSEVKVRG